MLLIPPGCPNLFDTVEGALSKIRLNNLLMTRKKGPFPTGGCTVFLAIKRNQGARTAGQVLSVSNGEHKEKSCCCVDFLLQCNVQKIDMRRQHRHTTHTSSTTYYYLAHSCACPLNLYREKGPRPSFPLVDFEFCS